HLAVALFSEVFFEQVPLFPEDLLKWFDPLPLVLRPDDGAVVNAAPAEPEAAFPSGPLFPAFLPLAAPVARMAQEVIVTLPLLPLADVVAEHRFGVRRTEHDRIPVRRLRVSGDLVKRDRGRVHARPQGVRAQPQ